MPCLVFEQQKKNERIYCRDSFSSMNVSALVHILRVHTPFDSLVSSCKWCKTEAPRMKDYSTAFFVFFFHFSSYRSILIVLGCHRRYLKIRKTVPMVDVIGQQTSILLVFWRLILECWTFDTSFSLAWWTLVCTNVDFSGLCCYWLCRSDSSKMLLVACLILQKPYIFGGLDTGVTTLLESSSNMDF